MPKKNLYNDLYERAQGGEHFTGLMPLTPEEVTAKVRYIVSGTKRGYPLAYMTD